VTNDLVRRVWQHSREDGSNFTSKHKLHKLVWFEETNQVQTSIEREKQLKRWHRKWKLDLVNAANQHWEDLASEWFEDVRDTESSSA